MEGGGGMKGRVWGVRVRKRGHIKKGKGSGTGTSHGITENIAGVGPGRVRTEVSPAYQDKLRGHWRAG